MKVIVSRSGGFAGIRLTWQVQLDERPDAEEWLALIAELPWNEVRPAPPEPDRYIYSIRCAQRSATLSEPQLEGPWLELVTRVQLSAKPEPARRFPGPAAPESPGPDDPRAGGR
ncbi:MAG: protealysin inhibitor emfourin [Microterricola sp.]